MTSENLEGKHNVLLIVADQFRYDVQGYVGKYPVKTPNLDKLAEDSVVFDNAYTSIPTCCPSRQSFYTGRRCESFGAYWNYNITMPIGGLPIQDYSFMRDFANAGYRNVHVGRPEISPMYGPTEFGYHRNRDVSLEYNKIHKKREGYSQEEYFFGEWIEEGPLNETLSGFTATCAIDEIDNLLQNEQPFFMTVCFMNPHPPYHPHEKFFGMYQSAEKWDGFDDSFDGKPYIQKQQVCNWGNQDRTWKDWEPIVRRYYAQVTETDYHIGRVLQHMRDKGIYDNTIIIFTADHGDMCGSHKMFDKHYVLYEDVTHVPLIIHAANRFPAHRSAEYTVHNLDLAPTLLELNGIRTKNKQCVGYSLVSVLKGCKSVRKEAVTTYNGAQFGLYTQRCIKTDKWKYIWNLTDIDELYNLDNDPGELVNLISRNEYSTIISCLRERLLKVLMEEGDTFCTIGRSWAAQRHLCDGQKIPILDMVQ